jgi:hypothetical protein
MTNKQQGRNSQETTTLGEILESAGVPRKVINEMDKAQPQPSGEGWVVPEGTRIITGDEPSGGGGGDASKPEWERELHDLLSDVRSNGMTLNDPDYYGSHELMRVNALEYRGLLDKATKLISRSDARAREDALEALGKSLRSVRVRENEYDIEMLVDTVRKSLSANRE